jgi:DNA-binding response OmpR family regulator
LEKSHHIILVEDDAELAKMMQSYLISEGYKVSWVDDGLDAVTLTTKRFKN